MTELELLRQKINNIDASLLDLLSDRVRIVQEVAEYKAKNDIPIYQPEREKELFVQLKHLSEQKGLDYSFVEPLFKLILENSKNIQEKLKNKQIV